MMATEDWRQTATTRCTMGVGCDEAGVCYAGAHGQPEMCPKGLRERVADTLMPYVPRGHLYAAADAALSVVLEWAGQVADSFDNCGTDSDPHHAIPLEIAAAIRATGRG